MEGVETQRHSLMGRGNGIPPKTIPVMEGVETTPREWGRGQLFDSEDYPRYGGG